MKPEKIDGHIFIPGDPQLFIHIDRFLRHKELPPISRDDLLLLRKEADFFQIEPLMAAIEQTLKN